MKHNYRRKPFRPQWVIKVILHIKNTILKNFQKNWICVRSTIAQMSKTWEWNSQLTELRFSFSLAISWSFCELLLSKTKVFGLDPFFTCRLISQLLVYKKLIAHCLLVETKLFREMFWIALNNNKKAVAKKKNWFCGIFLSEIFQQSHLRELRFI